MTYIVGITGGICSGKSTFASVLADLGIPVIDADAIGRQLVDERQEIRADIRDIFGPEIFDENDSIKRNELGRIVFSNPNALILLNRLIQRSLIEEIQRQINDYRNQGDPLIAVDMAILFESGIDSTFDEIIVVSAPKENRIAWACAERGLNREDVLERMRAQWSDEERTKRADTVIMNDKGRDELCLAARNWHQNWIDTYVQTS